MIVVEASVLVAILLDEDDGPHLRENLLQAEQAMLSPVGYWEAAVRLYRLKGPVGVDDLDRLLTSLQVFIMPATPQTARLAFKAELDFGKRTPAKLNLGDCFAYALAKESSAPILFKGGDFTRTDLTPALPASGLSA